MHWFHSKNKPRDCRSGNGNRGLAGHAVVAAVTSEESAGIAVAAIDAVELAVVDASERAPCAAAAPSVARASDKGSVHSKVRSSWQTLELQCEARRAGSLCLVCSFQ